MPSKPGLIARLFGRSQNSVVAKLYTHALNTPLLVHPGIGERLLGAYLQGSVDAPATAIDSAGSIAVINVSGAMVNRPMPDECGPGPLSYSSLRDTIASALADENVGSIILRMNSPGGMAAGLFDLTDWLFEQRGKKPIVAQIDDMAYSGGYALASACDSIQVTRTGGSGSVGVVCYHVDASAYDAKQGLKVTYIFSGDHKVDGNQHEPLPDDVKSAMQVEVNVLRELFVSSVARYRSMDPKVVFDTQAACYMGAAGIAAGLVDSLGTLEDLIQKLSTPVTPAPPAQETEDVNEDNQTPPPAEDNAVALAAENERHAAAVAQLTAATAPPAAAAMTPVELKAAITDAVTASSLAPALSMALLKASAKAPGTPGAIAQDQIAARIEHAGKVNDLCHAAKLDNCAAGYVERGTDLEQVRTELLAAAAQVTSPDLVTSLPAGGTAAASGLDTKAVYDRRNQRQKATRSN